MKMEIKKVLIYHNNFFGSYGSNQVYYKEISKTFGKLNIDYIIVHTVKEAITVLEKEEISFSLCHGLFDYYLNHIPLYDLYSVLHYQWLSDNPFKFHIDHYSKNIKYIFADSQFTLMAGKLAHQPLILSLGYLPSKHQQEFQRRKKEGIFFPCQIRSLNQICTEIDKSKHKNKIYDFIENYDMDSSYIEAVSSEIPEADDDREFFRLTNSYIRTKKRILAVKAIKSLPVYITGEQLDNQISADNFYFIGKIDFRNLALHMQKYQYVLNTDPNYHSCVHDRISRGVSAGAIVFSNENYVINEKNGFPCVYRFDCTITVYKTLKEIKHCLPEVFQIEKQFVAHYTWKKQIERIIHDFESNRKK